MTSANPAALSRTISATAKSDIDLASSLQWVARHHQIPPLIQMREIWTLRSRGCRLEPDRYYYYRLYRKDIPLEEKRRFVGVTMQRAMILACNAFTWWQAAQDKLAFHGAMRGNGFPVPMVHATVAARRYHGGAAQIEDAAALRDWLSRATYPFFMKPADSALGEGANILSGFDAATNMIALQDGKRIGLDALWQLATESKGGLIFQQLLHPHPALVPVTGERIASVRLVVLMKDGGPVLYDAAWRLPVGGNLVDNFFRLGNIMAALDLKSGAVGRAVQGKGVAMREVDAHPDSGALLAGFVLPDWARAVGLTLQAAGLFPNIRLQSWDIAMTAEGPVFLELNPGGNMDQRQFLHDEGLWKGELRDFVQRCYQDDVNAEVIYPRRLVRRLLAA